MTVSKAISRAWTDMDYKNKLLSDPRGALAEVGVALPAGVDVKVVENSPHTLHLVLPASPSGQDGMSLDDLEKIAAGKIIGIDTPDCI